MSRGPAPPHDRKGTDTMITINAGAIRITAINDGDCRLPALFYPGLDFARHPGLLAGDGTYASPQAAS